MSSLMTLPSRLRSRTTFACSTFKRNVCMVPLAGMSLSYSRLGTNCDFTPRFDHWDATQIYESAGFSIPDSSDDPTSEEAILDSTEGVQVCSSLAPDSCPFQTTVADDSCPFATVADDSCDTSPYEPSSSTISESSSGKVRMVEWSPEERRVKCGKKSESSKTYAQVCNDPLGQPLLPVDMEEVKKLPMCPFAIMSDECPHSESCQYLHGILCDLCNRMCLHPYDEDQQKAHHEECVKEHEKQMELSFAIQRSIDKNCGICMDAIMDKDPVDRRFGILEKCNHIFCLSCIRKWRQTKQFDNRTIRACPECRVNSDFVVPSKYWIDSPEDKDKLIQEYKRALSNKPCKYFKEGRGECPFAGACFYRHAYPDGRKAEMPPPRVRRTRQNQEGELETLRVCSFVSSNVSSN